MEPVRIRSNVARFDIDNSVYDPVTRNVTIGIGSQCAVEATASCPKSVNHSLKELRDAQIIAVYGNRWTFIKPYTFDNPNAAGVVLSRSSVDPREAFRVENTLISLKSFDHMHGIKTKAGK